MPNHGKVKNNQDNREHCLVYVQQPFEANDQRHIQIVDTIQLALKEKEIIVSLNKIMNFVFLPSPVG
jgi:hypothetical protein